MSRYDYLPIKRGLMRRPRIDALLKNGLEYTFTTIVAGFGYGKTTALATFASQIENPIVWVHLTEMDNEIPYFWNTYVSSVSRELPECAQKMEQLGFPDTPSQFLTLFNAISKLNFTDKHVVFIIDNYEVLSNPSIRQYIKRCIEMAVSRRNIHYFIISNERLDKEQHPVAKIVGSVSYHRIMSQDLAFTPEETANLFSFYGEMLSEETAREITAETEGWPVLLYLRCTNSQKTNSLSVLVEMFESQYFANYNDEMKRLLVNLSTLPFFTADIVNALIAADAASAIRLINLNVFIHYDNNKRIFHFQPMYKDILSSKQAMIPESERHKTMRTSAFFFFEDGRYNEARNLYFCAKDYDGFLKCLKKQLQISSSASNTRLVQDYLEQLPADYVKENLQIHLIMGLVYLNHAKVTKARQILEQLLEKLDESEPEQLWLIGEASRVIADISLLQGRTDGMEYIRKAVKFLPDGSWIQNKQIPGVNENSVFFLPEIGSGVLQYTVDFIKEFTIYRDKISSGCMYGYEFLFEAEAALYSCDFEKAERCALQSMFKANTMEQHDMVLNLYFLLMKCAFFMGDFDLAQKRLRNAEAYYTALNSVAYSELIDILRAWYYMMLDEDSKVAEWLRIYNPQVYAEKPLWQGRNLYISSIYMLRQNDFPQALYLLSCLEKVLEDRPIWDMNQFACILRCLLCIHGSDTQSALNSLREVYEATWQNGIYYPFAEFGQQIYPVLDLAFSGGGCDTNWLKTIRQKAEESQAVIFAMQRKHREYKGNSKKYSIQLTKREKEVLEMLKEGCNNEEIARHINIGVNGVKKRLSSIYTKLGAKNRTDAIYIAVQNDLI